MHYENTNNSEKDINESFDYQNRIVESKYETLGTMKIVENLKTTIEEKDNVIDELINDSDYCC